ncbi:GNAT family N-acetyltransferase [Streptomyces capparidis]
MTAVRPARPGDLPEVAVLAAEHAAYEKAGPPAPDLAERLGRLLFASPRPALRCLVADAGDGRLAGYATCAPEFATWQGHQYLHLDCLYLRPEHRGHGVGARLFEAVVAEARALGLDEVQWNTPPWNEGAIRFYDRLGATRREKVRFTLRVG